MAFTHTLVDRLCPAESFGYLDEVMAGCVGEVFYGESDPDKASVDVTTTYARLSGGRFMSLNVLVDTEDMPEAGWLITDSGLSVPPETQLDSEPVDIVAPDGLNPKQLYNHQLFQGRRLYEVVTSHHMWNSGKIGWPNEKDPSLKLKLAVGKKGPASKLGILVAKIEGAWVDADNKELPTIV